MDTFSRDHATNPTKQMPHYQTTLNAKPMTHGKKRQVKLC